MKFNRMELRKSANFAGSKYKLTQKRENSWSSWSEAVNIMVLNYLSVLIKCWMHFH